MSAIRTRRLAVDPSAPDGATLREAAATLRAGGVIAFPTETFYGLGAAGLHAGGVRRVHELKGRPQGKPLLLIVDSIAMAESLALDVPPAARALMARHWPGALTLVLKARPGLPDGVTAGTGTVGVRLSSAPVARGLVAALGGPITAPSANPSSLPPPSTPDGVLAHFDGALDLLVDGGATPGGAPSTVLDVTVDPPRVLRQGAISLGSPT